MSSLHQSLYIKGKFPVFAKARFFGRYEEDVIEERKKSALELLEYVNGHPVLLSSAPFLSFFEDGEKSVFKLSRQTSDSSHILDEPPVMIMPVQEDQHAERSQGSSPDSNDGPSLGGVWNYRKPVDDISFNSEEDLSQDEGTTFTDSDSMLSTPLPSSEFSFFDPLYEKSPISKESFSEKSEHHSKCDDSVLDDFQNLSPPTQNSEQIFNFPDVLNDAIKINATFDEADASMSRQTVRPENIDVSEFDPLMSTSKDISGLPVSPLSPLSPTVGTNSTDIPRYLFDAAGIIGLAQQHEVDTKYRQAFQCYKAGVNILLSGVQDERDPLRRDAIRKKISRYMRRAEELYCYHLADDPDDKKIWSNVGLHLKAGSLMRPRSQLKQFKVLGVIDKVSLVLDTISQNTYIMKALYKTSHPMKLSVPSIVPTQIPFMINLHKVFETEYAIFLLLEHASGGRLWNYVSEYVKTSPCSPSRDLNCPTSKLISPLKTAEKEPPNVYSGKQLLSDEFDQNKAEPEVIYGQTPTNCQTDACFDEDLCAEPDYPSSYIQLFTNYASSRTQNSDTGLAKCKIMSTSDEDYTIELLTVTANSQVSDNNVIYSPRIKENIAANDPLPTNSAEDLSSKSESDDLIHNARKLLNDVDDTLHKSRTGFLSATKEVRQMHSKTTTAKEASAVKPQSMSFTSFTPQLKNKRSVSSTMHDPFMSPVDSPIGTRRRSSSYGGNCENVRHSQINNSRCFTAIFKQMDDLDQSIAAYLPEKTVKSWAAEMVLAISKLHLMGIICRDLKPNNILLGEGGHIKLTYFSQWNCVENEIDWSAAEKMYCAPEMDGIQPYSTAADWWSLGSLLYELLTGRTLISCHPAGFTSHTQIYLPDHLSTESCSFLEKLLAFSPSERLGSSLNGVEDIKSHPFFSDFDWHACQQ